MFAQLKRLGVDSLLYAFMNIGTKLIAILMLPIYTHYLKKDGYDVVTLIDSITSMLTFLIIFGTDSALAFYYYDQKEEKKRLAYIRNVMYFRICVVGILFLLVFIFGNWFSSSILHNSSYVNLLYINLFILFFDTIFVVVTMVMRYQSYAKRVVFFTVLKMACIAVLSFVFLKYVAKTPESLYFGRLVTSIALFVIMLKFSLPFLKPQFDREVMKNILTYAAPLAPTSIAFWVISSGNLFFINHYAAEGEVGIFGAAMRLATMITLLTSGIQLAWRPFTMSQKDKEGSEKLFAKIYILLLVVGVVGILAIATISPLIMKLFTSEEFHGGYQYIAGLSTVTFLNFYYLIISIGLFFKKETAYISKVFLACAGINLALNALLIPNYLGWGAVVTNIVTYVVAIYFIFRKSQQVYFIPVSTVKMYTLLLLMICSSFIIAYIQVQELGIFWIGMVWLFAFVVIGLMRVDKMIR